MARKRRVKRASHRIKRRVAPRIRNVRASGNKINLVWKNFLLFLILALISVGIYNVSKVELYIYLFSLLSILFGALALAFFIALLVLWLLKLSRK